MTQTLTNSDHPHVTQAKLTFLRWLAIYPTTTLVLWVLGPLLFGRFPLAVATLLLTLLVVSTVHYLLLPALSRLTKTWVTVPSFKGSAHHRMGMVMWLSTYPAFTLVLLVLLPALQGRLPQALLGLCISLVAVPLISYVVLPNLVKLLRPWIFGRA